ncbi:MAG: hypothetical protein GC165_07550 [Armatimonadetes bacterium]|nr:hypothetical protein [Armatimonadota bacterium]
MILRLNFTIVKFSYFDFKRSASLIDRLHRRNLVAKPHEIANAAVALNTGMKILVVDPKDCIYLSMFDDGDQDLA